MKNELETIKEDIFKLSEEYQTLLNDDKKCMLNIAKLSNEIKTDDVLQYHKTFKILMIRQIEILKSRQL